MSKTFRLFFCLGAFAFALSAQQALTGTIAGTITDASGAAVPEARITARNAATGLEREVNSEGQGLYTLPLLPVGEYEITATKQGFSEAKVGPVKVGVGQSITVELHLTVAAYAIIMVVTNSTHITPAGSCCCVRHYTGFSFTADVADIETTRSSVATTVDSSQIANLGLNGRDFLKFLLLAPGVTTDVRTGDSQFRRFRRAR